MKDELSKKLSQKIFNEALGLGYAAWQLTDVEMTKDGGVWIGNRRIGKIREPYDRYALEIEAPVQELARMECLVPTKTGSFLRKLLYRIATFNFN
jgi:hypothetical protein